MKHVIGSDASLLSSFDERHHAWIVSDFYRLLLAERGESACETFLLATRAYGEQRGRRMAMRALADGRPLDLVSYFAYGEYPSTDAYFDVEMWDDDGVVHEQVTRCPWAGVFSERGLKACGLAYCSQIDASILRGFNPALGLRLASTQHDGPSCRFFFMQDGLVAGALDRADELGVDPAYAIMPLAYHCAHVLHAFEATVRGAAPDCAERVIGGVRGSFAAKFGEEALAALLAGMRAAQGFEIIISAERWLSDAAR